MAYYFDEVNRFAEVAERAELPYLQSGLNHFESWMRAREIPLIKLTRIQAKEYVQYLKQMDVVPSYAKACLSVANDFYSWWYGAPNLSPFRNLKISVPQSRSKKPKKVTGIRIHSEYQIARLNGAIKRLHTDPYRYYRAQTIFSLALYLGLNLTEMTQLTVQDASSRDGVLVLVDREIPFAPQMRSLMRQYLAYRASKVWGNVPHLFLSKNDEPLTPATLAGELRAISNEAGIMANIRTLNDTFAYNLAVDGAPASVIMKLRGCKYAMAETFIELALNGEDVAEVYEKSVTQRMRPVKRRVRRVI